MPRIFALHRTARRLARGTEGARTSVRVWALLALVGCGAAVGALGVWLTGSDGWWLALPVAIAAGWLFLANPLACERQDRD